MCAVRRDDRVELTIGPRQLRGGVAAAEASPARPTHGGSRSIERGCTGRAGRCSRPRRKFGLRRRRAPSVRHRRRGVCHCASAQPCLDCSPTQAGQTLLGLAIPAGRARCGRVGSVAACRVLLSCGAGRYGWGWAGWAWPEGLGPPGPMGGRLPGRRRRCQARRRRCQRALMSAQRWLDRAGVGLAAARPAQIGGQVAGCRSPPRARAQPSRRSGPGRSPAVTSCLLGWAAVASPRTALAPPKEAAMSTWLWVLIIVVVLVVVFGVMRRRGR